MWCAKTELLGSEVIGSARAYNVGGAGLLGAPLVLVQLKAGHRQHDLMVTSDHDARDFVLYGRGWQHGNVGL